jgi:hypothetical protein
MAEPTEQQGGAEQGTPSRPEYLDARFTSVEEQAKAYKEAEKLMQQKSQRAAELERQNQELLSRQQAVPAVAPQEQVDYNELYWKEPATVMDRLVQKHVEPFFEERFEMQKNALKAENPGAEKYFPQIDAMVKAQPGLKNKPGIVKQLVKVASAMEFDPDAERKRIEAQVRAEITGKVQTGVEGAGAAQAGTQTQLPELTADEKRAAEKFHRDLTPFEAYKKYAENKVKFQTGAY